MKIGTQELLIILIIVVLLFGPTQIPKLSRMFGKSVKSFRDSMAEEEEKEEKSASESAEKTEA